MNPYLFMVGCPRSGTTLLRRLVDAHPHIAIPPSEQHWLAKWYDRGRGVTPDGNISADLLPELLRYPKFARMELDPEALEQAARDDPPIPYPTFVNRVFDLYARSRGKPFAGNKTPGDVKRIPELHALWPEARFVHIFRDGRDVCLSVLGWDRSAKMAERLTTWREDPLTTASLWWEDMVRRGREAGTRLGPALYHEVRYEDLVSDPEGECRTLCSFLEVPYDRAMMRFHEGRTRDRPDLSAKKAWLPVTSGLRDWRTQMPAEDVERFEAAAGHLLSELGYERRFPDPDPELLEHAARLRESFDRHTGSRG